MFRPRVSEQLLPAVSAGFSALTLSSALKNPARFWCIPRAFPLRTNPGILSSFCSRDDSIQTQALPISDTRHVQNSSQQDAPAPFAAAALHKRPPGSERRPQWRDNVALRPGSPGKMAGSMFPGSSQLPQASPALRGACSGGRGPRPRAGRPVCPGFRAFLPPGRPVSPELAGGPGWADQERFGIGVVRLFQKPSKKEAQVEQLNVAPVGHLTAGPAHYIERFFFVLGSKI